MIDPSLISPLEVEAISAACSAMVRFLPETHSTNDDARAAAAAGAAHGTVFLTDNQTGGRGRRGAAWHSPPGRNFLGSIILRPELPPEKWPRLTHACALAVCLALEDTAGSPPAQIKWPNDVILSGKKVCGILVEGVLHAGAGSVIAGIGVNLNMLSSDFAPDIRGAATSAWLENGRLPIDRTAFCISLLRHLQRTVQAVADAPESILHECASRSSLHGQRLTMLCGRDVREGTFCGLGPEGELVLQTASGQELISSADLVRPVRDWVASNGTTLTDAPVTSFP